MKKIIAWLLLLTMLVGMFAGCKKVETNTPTEPSTTEAPISEADIDGINAAIDYLKGFYKDDGSETPVDYERFGIVRIGGVPFEVVWTVDVSEDLIKIVVNDDGTVTIDVNENCEEDTPYVLTATVTDATGNSASHSWNHILPKAVDMISIVEAAYALAPGESLPYESTLRGKITSIKTPWDDGYKNITVIIEIEGIEDKPIECYRLKGEGADKLQVGDIITVTGTLKNYNGTIEFDAGCVLNAVIEGERVKAPDDMKQIVDEAYALGANKSLPYEATLTGTVVKIGSPYDEFYGNITVSIEVEGREGKPIVCYRMKGDGVDKIGLNDLITVTGYITNYVGSAGYSTIEFTAGCKLEKWEDREAPKAPADMKQIVDEAYALAPNASLKYEAVLKGVITKVNTAYDANFNNITVTIEVEGRETKPIKCYRMKGNGVDQLDIGDVITVKGFITNYQHPSGDTEVEYTAGCELVSYEKNTNVAPSDPLKIVEEAYALAPGKQLPYKATLTGKITKVNTAFDAGFNNVTVTIVVEGAEDKPIKCYRMKGSGADQIGEGDTITVSGYITNYQHTSGDTEVEFEAGCSLVSWSDTGAGGSEQKPTAPSVANPDYVTNPVAGTPYKMGMYTGSQLLMFTGATESESVNFRLATTGDSTQAVDVYLEAVSGGYQLYYMNAGVKTYIRVYERTPDKAGFGKGSIELVTAAPSEYFTYDTTANTLVYTASADNAYYMGTYGTFTTVSVSNTYYITGDKAANVDVSQYPVRFYPSDVTVEPAPEVPTEPTEPTPTIPEDKITLVTAPAAGTGYKMGMNKNGTILFFTGATESESVNYRLATTTNPQEAVDVYLEAVSGGYQLYYMNAGVKTYIKVYERTAGDPGFGKGSIELVTAAPTEVFTYDTAANTLIYTASADNAYYMGTYSTFTTFSVSNTYYITGDKASTVDVSQYPARFYTVDASYVPETTEPATTQPATTEPAPTQPVPGAKIPSLVSSVEAGKAYKMAMDKKDGALLYFNGLTESATVTYRLASTTNVAEAVDVYLEAVTGGYLLYYMNAGVKTYIKVYERTAGNPGYGKGSLELVTTAPTEYFTYDATANTLIHTANADNAYYLGTYSTFTTFSVSNTYYITGDKASTVDVSQFPARFYEMVEVPSDPAVQGWKEIAGVWFYYQDGTAVTGWQQLGGVWYFFDASGAMQTGWQKLSDVWHYFDASGAMQTGWQKLDGVWYYFDASGAMQTGWLQVNGVWYYLNDSGAMQIGWQQIGGVWYFFDDGGAWDADAVYEEPSEDPSEPSVLVPTLATSVEAGKAYKMAMDKKDGVLLYFNGLTESAEVTYRLATTTNVEEAVDVYLEEVSGGYLLYFMNGDAKTYIKVYERQTGDPGFGKGSLELVTAAPTEVFTYDATANTLIYTASADNAYYMGTYSTFSTFSVSNTYYITGDKASTVDVSQFPARFYTLEEGTEQPTEPTEPESTEPETSEPASEPQDGPFEAGKAYKMVMNKNGNVLYFNGLTESQAVTYRLATTTNVAEAVDVFVDVVSGGYQLYFMNAGVKTYIRVYERADGNAGAGKGSLEFVTAAPAEVLTYDATANTLIYTADADNSYYMGTYGDFVTFSVSNTSYITGGNAGNVDVSQYPARLVDPSAEPEPSEPETSEPEVSEPESTPSGTEEYVKVTSLSDITSGGEFVIAAVYNGSYVAIDTAISTKINGVALTVEDDVVTTENPASWTVASSGTGITISNGTNFLNDGSSTNFAKGTSAKVWTVVDNGDGTFTIRSSEANRTNRAIAYQYSALVSGTPEVKNRFGMYADSNMESEDYSFKLVLFKKG